MKEEIMQRLEIASKILAGLCSNPALVSDPKNSDFYGISDRLVSSAWSYAGKLLSTADQFDKGGPQY